LSRHNVWFVSVLLMACSSGGSSRPATDAMVTADAGSDAAADATRDAGAEDAEAGAPSGPATTRAGTACDNTGESCGGDLVCSWDDSCTDESCTPLCKRVVASCLDNACGNDALCRGLLNQTGGTCEPRRKLGQPCSDLPSNIDENPCEDGTYCLLVGGAFDPGMCVAQDNVANGDCEQRTWAGTERFMCPKGYTCVAKTLGAPHKCIPVKLENEACLNSSDCDFGLYCGDGYLCKKRGKVGAKCDDQKGDVECPVGGLCLGGICQG